MRVRAGVADEVAAVGGPVEGGRAPSGGAGRRSPGPSAGLVAAAARLVAPGTSVALGSGPGAEALAVRLRPVEDLTVVTTSLPVARVLGTDVVVTGGTQTPTGGLVGPVAVAALHGLRVDLAVLAPWGVDGSAGLTAPTVLEAEIARALATAGQAVAVLAPRQVVGRVGLSSFLDLRGVDVLVTERGVALPPPVVRAVGRVLVG